MRNLTRGVLPIRSTSDSCTCIGSSCFALALRRYPTEPECRADQHAKTTTDRAFTVTLCSPRWTAVSATWGEFRSHVLGRPRCGTHCRPAPRYRVARPRFPSVPGGGRRARDGDP